MLIFAPNFARRIDLPGAGPCPRPVDIDRFSTGFADLVSLRVYSFAQGVVIDGEAEDDEVFIVLMHGKADIAISRGGEAAVSFALRHDGGMRAVFMPPHASYRLSAVTDCDIAYARAQSVGTAQPVVQGFTATGSRLDVIGHATAMDLALAGVRAGEDANLCGDGLLPERLLHLRAGRTLSASVNGETVGDWASVALGQNDPLALAINQGAGEVLLITATKDHDLHRKVPTI